MGKEWAERQGNYFWEPLLHWTVPPCQSGRDPLVSCWMLWVPHLRCRSRHEAGHTQGLRSKGQGSQTSHAFAKGCVTSTLPSQEERFLICAPRNNETKCGIWELLISRGLGKRSRKQKRKILCWFFYRRLSSVEHRENIRCKLSFNCLFEPCTIMSKCNYLKPKNAINCLLY